MPMIDIYAPKNTFSDVKSTAQKAAELVMTIEEVPNIPMFRQNTVGFVHEMDNNAISNVDSEDGIRVQILTNKDALDRQKQLDLVEQMTDMIAKQANRDSTDKIWVLLTEATSGGWGIWGHAHENEELVVAARKQIEELSKDK